MYHILPQSHDNIIAIHVEGYMRDEDYATLIPFVEEIIQKHGSVSLLVDLEHFSGIEGKALFKRFPAFFKFRNKVDKKAILTDSDWVRRWSRWLSPFFKTEVECFPPGEFDRALAWIEH